MNDVFFGKIINDHRIIKREQRLFLYLLFEEESFFFCVIASD